MVVTLREWSPEVVEERTGLEENYYTILGIKVPHIEFYVRPGRDIARLTEVAAMVQALKRMGHDPAKDFNDRLIAYMQRDQTAAKSLVHKVSTAAKEPLLPGVELDNQLPSEEESGLTPPPSG